MRSSVSDHRVRRQFEDGITRFRWFGSPLYAELCRRVADDAELLELASEAPEGQPFTHLLFAAVHAIVLDGSGGGLSGYFPSVGGSANADPDTVFVEFRRFCADQRTEIVSLMKRRTVQFTMPGRAAFMLPALSYVANLAGEPFSLIDIGCGAGLLTNFTEYAYDYGFGERIGDRSKLVLSGFRWIGEPPHALIKKIPVVGSRVGIDLNPIDPRDPDEFRWIDALCPPDMVEERRSLRAAMELRGRSNIPVVRGDALKRVPPILATMKNPICVMATHCLYQWPEAARSALDAELRAASAHRNIYQVTIDHPSALNPARVMPKANIDDDQMPIEHEAVLTRYRDGKAASHLLGRYDSLGRRGIWLAHQQVEVR
jgi:hypothetical protein